MDRLVKIQSPVPGEGTMSAHKRVMFVDDEEGVRVSWNRYL